MTNRRLLTALAVLLMGASGCFEDLRPRLVNIRVDGPAGAPVELHMTKNFFAGIDENGVTQVTAFTLDTVRTVLPMDTSVSVSLEQRFFMQLLPRQADSLDVSLDIDIDGRSRVDDRGLIFAADPFRFVFMFNTPTTLVIELL